MKCTKHRRYQAKRQPRVACAACWASWFEAEKIRGWREEARVAGEQIAASNGGKDRPTEHCTVPHLAQDMCYGCDPYWRRLGAQ